MASRKNNRNTNRARMKLIWGPALLINDILIINAAFLLSFWLRFYSGWMPVLRGVPGFENYLYVPPFLTAIMVILINAHRLYVERARLATIDEAFALLKISSAGFFVFMAASFIHRDFSYSRGLLLVAWISVTFALIGSRFFINRLRIFLRQKQFGLRNLLVIGTGDIAVNLVKNVSKNPHWDYRVVGLLRTDGAPKAKEVAGFPVLGGLKETGRVLDNNSVEEVILADQSLCRDEILGLVMECEERLIGFKLLADLLGMVTSSVDMQNIDGFPLLGLKESPLNEWYNRFIKRVMDIAGALSGLLVMSPLLLTIAALIKLGPKGPVFYVQKRIGEDGRRFTMIKFRTMIAGAEKQNGIGWTKPDDPRRTKTGAFLRRYNLDELPQLLNVLTGDMSLVGPRPERPRYVKAFKHSIPRYMARHKIRSGMTGWAQVNGLRGDTSIEERTKYDLYYIENWSIWFDIKILLMSFLTLGKGY